MEVVCVLVMCLFVYFCSGEEGDVELFRDGEKLLEMDVDGVM